MNQTTQKRRRVSPASTPAVESPPGVTPPDDAVVAQAWALDEIFKGFARRVLIDDDPASALPLRQLRVCLTLYEAPRSMSEISRELGFSLSAMTQIADRLERAGLVTRWFEGPDRRVRRLRLTPRARRMLRIREEARIRRVAAVLGTMNESSRQSVLAAFDALRQAAVLVSNAVLASDTVRQSTEAQATDSPSADASASHDD